MASILENYGVHEWLCKSNFSFLIGASHPKDLAKRATALSYQSLCLNDFDGVYGLARMHLALKELKKEKNGPMPKLNSGAEIHFSQDHDLPLLLQKTLVLVAKNKCGYHNLCRILSFAHREGKEKAYVPIADLLKADVSGLFAIQPMRGAVRVGQKSEQLEDLYAHFRGEFYFALSRHFHPAEDQWIRPTLALAKKLGALCLLSQDVFFHQRSEKCMSDLVNAIRNNKALSDAHAYFFPNGERSLHDATYFNSAFSSLPVYEAALKLSAQLNASCEFDLSQLHYHYPKEMIPSGFSAQDYLKQLTWAGAKKRYGTQLSKKIIGTLNHELDLIAKLSFADYFLTVWDIVCWARGQNILCQGRGSAANSAVCFVLGITSADPALFDLLFERFISMERGDPPDIDVDFEHERREEVVQYIYRRYGRDRAAMVANVITFRNKGAMRATGKALGLSETVLTRVSHLAESKHFRSSETQDLFAEAKKTGQSKNTSTEGIPWKLWATLADKLQGFPRHLGIHSGGFMLSDASLNHLVPQEPATMVGRTVVQWSKEDIEGLGFFKIDVLSLGMLTAVRKCFDEVKVHYGVSLSLANIPQGDLPTYQMIQNADTVGTFQIESRAQMSMLPRLKPRCFYDLVIQIAIIRPGPIQGKVIHPYLERREGKAPITFPDLKLKPILSRTLGVPIFQEQLMRIAMAVGDFTPGEADELRKNIGVWNVKAFERNLNPWIEKLKRGMEKRGISQVFIDQILGQMRGFANYGFPESHAISFALIAYASSYLKCHYPAAFFVAVLNSQPMGFYAPHTLLQAAKRNGVTISAITINDSFWDNRLEALKKDRDGQTIWGIRLGFRLIKGLSESGTLRLLSVREQSGAWRDFDHFIQTTEVYRNDFSALAAANAFAGFGLARAEALWQAEALPFSPLLVAPEQTLPWRAESTLTQIQHDFGAFQSTLSEHPVMVIKKEEWPYTVSLKNILRAEQLAGCIRNRIVNVFGMTIIRQAPPSAKGMVFITMEDESGFLNLVFTPQIYAQYYKALDRQPFLCVEGRLQKANTHHSILVNKVCRPALSNNIVPFKKASTKQKTTKPLQWEPFITPRQFH